MVSTQSCTRLLAVLLATGAFLGAGPLVVSAGQAPQKPIPAEPAKAPLKVTPSSSSETQNKQRTEPIAVTGMARDEQGLPIKGASIYLVSTNGADRALDTVKSDENGVYSLKGQLSIRQSPGMIPQGTFQVFGVAPGYAFAWQGMKTLMMEKRPANSISRAQDTLFYAGEPLALDLTFHPGTTIAGRVVDEKDQPLPGVKFQLSSCDYLDIEGKESHVNYREFWAIYMLPEALRTATTDADGRFSFAGVPREAIFWLRFKHPDFAQQSMYAATTRKPLPAKIEKVVQRPGQPRPTIATGDISVKLVASRRIQVQVVAANTHEPVAGVDVWGSAGQATGSSSGGKTDSEGRIELKLPPGDYSLDIRPPRGASFVRKGDKLQVNAAPMNQTKQLTLEPACVVVLEAVDAETCKGIPGVGFWHGSNGTRTSVQSDTTYIDHPRTNAEGRIRAIVNPGSDFFYAGPIEGYQLEGDQRLPVVLPAGKTVTVQFKMRKLKP